MSNSPLAHTVILEQPAPKALRFRYECEGRSAGSLPGANSTHDKKTYPKIQVVPNPAAPLPPRGVVVVSCVTVDAPYRPHPHNLVGKEGCKKGVCTMEMSTVDGLMSCEFSNLGIQCVKKKDIEESLRIREEIRVDPYRTGFAHRSQPGSIDLNSVRLCFQVFLEGPERGQFKVPVKPVVSEPIYDKKAINDLTIMKLSDCTSPVLGNKEIILLCDKVSKDDIEVRFYEEDEEGNVVWEALGDFQPSDVHKQYAIALRTPAYRDLEVNSPTRRTYVQLRCPSKDTNSLPRPFEFVPISAGIFNLNKKRKIEALELEQALDMGDYARVGQATLGGLSNVNNNMMSIPKNIEVEEEGIYDLDLDVIRRVAEGGGGGGGTAGQGDLGTTTMGFENNRNLDAPVPQQPVVAMEVEPPINNSLPQPPPRPPKSPILLPKLNNNGPPPQLPPKKSPTKQTSSPQKSATSFFKNLFKSPKKSSSSNTSTTTTTTTVVASSNPNPKAVSNTNINVTPINGNVNEVTAATTTLSLDTTTSPTTDNNPLSPTDQLLSDLDEILAVETAEQAALYTDCAPKATANLSDGLQTKRKRMMLNAQRIEGHLSGNGRGAMAFPSSSPLNVRTTIPSLFSGGGALGGSSLFPSLHPPSSSAGSFLLPPNILPPQPSPPNYYQLSSSPGPPPPYHSPIPPSQGSPGGGGPGQGQVHPFMIKQEQGDGDQGQMNWNENNNNMDLSNISLPNLSDVNLSLLESHLSENFSERLDLG